MRGHNLQQLNEEMIRLEGIVYETMNRIGTFEGRLKTLELRVGRIEASLKKAHGSLTFVKQRLRSKANKTPEPRKTPEKKNDLPSFT